MYDTIVIGAGIVGCAIARELSKYELDTCVLEAGSDIAEGTTKANSAIVHAGYDAKPGSMKACLNVEGNAMFAQLAEDLDFEFKPIGSLVLRFEGDDPNGLEELKARGEQNGVPGMRIIGREELLEMEPNVTDETTDALFAPTGGIVCPYGMTEAYAENACSNGVDFFFSAEVSDISRKGGIYSIVASGKKYRARSIINAAGLFADDISIMAGGEDFKLHPRKGEYLLFDRDVASHVKKVVFQLPGPLGKGVLITPTADGNMIVGPSADDLDDKEDLATTETGLGGIREAATRSIKNLPFKSVIHSFAGLRARPETDDFIIHEDEKMELLFHAAGIESPGLTSAPAIGVHVAHMVAERLEADPNAQFIPKRKRIPKFLTMTDEQREKHIEQDIRYANIICRCETVTEAEIVQAIHRKPGATTLDGVKRRTRAGMGRCQAGFCMTKVMEILERELDIPPENVTKRGGNSKVIAGRIKESDPCVK